MDGPVRVAGIYRGSVSGIECLRLCHAREDRGTGDRLAIDDRIISDLDSVIPEDVLVDSRRAEAAAAVGNTRT